MKRLLALLLMLVPLAAVAATGETHVLATLVAGHPRLLLSDARLAALKETAATDLVLGGAVTKVLAHADAALTAGPVALTDTGTIVQEEKKRVYPLALAYRWTGEEKYARRVEQELLAMCALTNWTPEQSFLGTAEMSCVVGLGYDWCFKALGDETRRAIRSGVMRNGIDPFLKAYADKVWWTHTAFNWNQVCNGGTLVGALAIAEEQPAAAGKAVAAAVQSLPLALHTYDPDGMWGEGMDYWQYATDYTVMGLAALQTALGTDFGLGEGEGLRNAAMAVVWAAGPFRQYVNFADTLENKKRWALPYLFYLAGRYGVPYAVGVEREAMVQWPEMLDIAWYQPAVAEELAHPALDKLFRGPVELATFRSAWDDGTALFASLKAGDNAVNHGHRDLGVFEVDALGVRWARDLGKDSYGLPGYFSDRKEGGKAWEVYRLRSVSHSVPLIDGRDQPLSAKARMAAFASTSNRVFAVVDFTEAYQPAARSARRGLALIGGRRGVLVQDELELAKPCALTWTMTTDARIEVEKGRATLTLQGRQMQAAILSPPDAVFAVESAAQPPPQAANTGVSRLLIRVPCQAGPLRVSVLLTPVWPDRKDVPVPELKALSNW